MNKSHRFPLSNATLVAGLCLSMVAPVLARTLSNPDTALDVQAVLRGEVPLEQVPPSPQQIEPPAVQNAPPRIQFMPSPSGLSSVQVNVNGSGMNIIGDAANEPSIAVDPQNPDRIAIGWRQFDNVNDDFREAGVAWSGDGGQSWQASTLDNGVFRSDPVLASDDRGRFYYTSLFVSPDFGIDLWRSDDGGQNWQAPVPAFGGDKQWVAVDSDGNPFGSHLYMAWNTAGNPHFPATFTRTTDSGEHFDMPIEIPQRPRFGSLAVDDQGRLYVIGINSNSEFQVLRSDNPTNTGQTPSFNQVTSLDLGGSQGLGTGVNPVGLLGQSWIAAAPDNARGGSNVYVLCSVDPPGSDPLDVMFARSMDGGATFQTPIRVNDDPTDNDAWNWFGTLSVAPNGRIDVIWNDTRANPGGDQSVLYYSYSIDAGASFAANQALTPAFDHTLGYPQQNKLGDYYHMVSTNLGAHLAYAATFNSEQDVYYLFIPAPGDLFSDGFESD